LEGRLGAEAVKLEEGPAPPDGSYPDPGTVVAIVALTDVALKGLVAYLALRRRGSRIRQRIEYETESGQRVQRVLEVEVAPGETPEAAVLRELSSAPDLELPQLDSPGG
jgi:hypothetical protein